MKKIKGIMFFILLILLVGAVSASEDVNDTISVPDSNMELQDDVSDTLCAEENNDAISIEDDTALAAEDDTKLAQQPEEVLTSDYTSAAKITVSTVTGTAGEYITLKATVKNDLGNPEPATVEFKFNGETYTATTDSNGVATYKVKCPKTEAVGTTSKTKGKTLTKTTTYKATYVCDVTAYGDGYYKTSTSFQVISKKSPLVKKYKIIKKKKTYTIKVKNGLKKYKKGKYAIATYKHKGGYGTVLETAAGKINSGFIKFFIKHHYKKNGKWKWDKWRKIPKDYSDEFTYGSAVKLDKIKVRYTQVTYKRIK